MVACITVVSLDDFPTSHISYKILRRYVKKYGHARVPRSLDNQKFPKLGGWVHRQRMVCIVNNIEINFFCHIVFLP